MIHQWLEIMERINSGEMPPEDANVRPQAEESGKIASRLSYLLWNTMPDTELFAVAERGQLRDKTVLAQQVARLLADARSQRFTDSLTSDGVRHRPVHRGVWVMESIFGRSPPPPPANVNPIPTNPTGPKATLRQKLEAHIQDANCAVCHAKIDPLGLAFENYDAIGRWRTEEVTDGIGENPTVTAEGKLPDGRTYQTADEFKKLLVEDLDAFNHTFIEKLATYALRRSMSFDDRDDRKAIAVVSKAEDYRVTEIVTALVTSDLFQKR